MDAIDEQLVHHPVVETRNRRPMRPNVLGAALELRVRDLRVYSGVDGAQGVVTVRGVGVKDRNRIRLGKEWVEL